MIQYKYFPTVFVCVVDRFLSPVSQRIDCYKYPNSVLQTKKAVFFSNAHHAHHAHAHLTLVWGGNGQDGVAPPPQNITDWDINYILLTNQCFCLKVLLFGQVIGATSSNAHISACIIFQVSKFNMSQNLGEEYLSAYIYIYFIFCIFPQKRSGS